MTAQGNKENNGRGRGSNATNAPDGHGTTSEDFLRWELWRRVGGKGRHIATRCQYAPKGYPRLAAWSRSGRRKTTMNLRYSDDGINRWKQVSWRDHGKCVGRSVKPPRVPKHVLPGVRLRRYLCAISSGSGTPRPACAPMRRPPPPHIHRTVPRNPQPIVKEIAS